MIHKLIQWVKRKLGIKPSQTPTYGSEDKDWTGIGGDNLL